MKTRTLDLAYEWGLDIVEVTQGMNGYPEGLYKAVKGFDYFEDAESFADEICGEVVLLTKRDGHQFWTNKGRAYEGIDREKFINDSRYEIFTDEERFEDWCCDEIDSIMQGGFNLFDLKNTLHIMCHTYDEIYSRCSNEIILVDKVDYTCEAVEKEATEIHDEDVTTYAIAVVDHKTDEDETNEEEED